MDAEGLLDKKVPDGYGALNADNLENPQEVRASSSYYASLFSSSRENLANAWTGLRGREQGNLDWISLVVVYWVTLVSEGSRGLVLPSQWPFLETLHGSKSFLGVLVASFSFGRMISTVPLGFLSDNFSMKIVLVACSFLQILGNVMYTGAMNKWAVLLARTVIGFGSATMSVCRAHVTRSLPRERRTYHFAYLSALQFVGFACLPGAGGLMATLPEIGHGAFSLNEYRYPGYFLILANIIAIAVLMTMYEDPPPNSAQNATASSATASNRNGSSVSTRARPDFVALSVCLVINVAFRGIVAQLETVAAPFIMEKFSVSLSTASYYVSCLGFIGLIVYVSFKPISRAFSDRLLVLVGLVVAVVASVLFLLFADQMPIVVWVSVLGLIWSISYPVGQTAILGLFSKVLAGLPAGGFLGLFSAAGSLARLLFATAAGISWNNFGRLSVFSEMAIYMTLTLVITALFYPRLKSGRSI
ncbi:hypothetical protein NDN08_001412 [Rhodosorus marinus]|uniref:Major facilitator superfamily (MFS) profile domain-containing protein n=1 Tax=Rhodosorus marinus TaxID=101924 RepID=A0AAV8UUW7_9RHOD|nr:hypothetical protein NDN08_001412 [Rhodosorus marinus]